MNHKEKELTYKIEEDVNAIDPDKWLFFVRQHPDGNFFQTPGFYGFAGKVRGLQPVVVAALSGEGCILGIIVGIIQKESGYLKGKFSSRLIVWGGPLLAQSSSEITDDLLKTLIKRYRKLCIYFEFRNLHSLEDRKTYFLQNRFTYSDYLDFVVDTNKFRGSVQKLSAGKRRQVKRSLENGATIVENVTIEQLKKFYSILKELYRKKVKKPLPSWDFFEQFYYHPELGRFFLIEYSGEIAGGIMCPVYDNRIIYEWYIAGEDGKHKGVYPSVLATWAPINYALNNGLLQFDFLGAGSPDDDYGVREFKSSFGGDMVNYGRFTRINNKVLYYIGKAGLSALKKIQY